VNVHEPWAYDTSVQIDEETRQMFESPIPRGKLGRTEKIACPWWNDFRVGNRLLQRASAKPFKQPTSTKFPKEELYGSGRILGRYFGYAESRRLA
jgi:hypothetical protein